MDNFIDIIRLINGIILILLSFYTVITFEQEPTNGTNDEVLKRSLYLIGICFILLFILIFSYNI